MTMNTSLSAYVNGLVSENNLQKIELVDDRCHGLSEETRNLVHLSYQSHGPINANRWGSSVESPCKRHQKRSTKAEKSQLSPVVPCRRSSVDRASLQWRLENVPHLNQKSQEALSCAKWAMALDMRFEDDDSVCSDGHSSCSSFSFNDYISDDDDDSSVDSRDDDSDSDDDDYSVSESSDEEDDEDDDIPARKELHTHDWVLPQNAILPNMQEILREASRNPDMDFMARLRSFSVAA